MQIYHPTFEMIWRTSNSCDHENSRVIRAVIAEISMHSFLSLLLKERREVGILLIKSIKESLIYLVFHKHLMEADQLADKLEDKIPPEGSFRLLTRCDFSSQID